MRNLMAFTLLILLLTGLHAEADTIATETQVIGVNLAGGEFGPTPGLFGKDYIYPGVRQFDYCQKKGIRLIRLPFKWERIQSQQMGPLQNEELARLDQAVKLAADRNLKLLLDMHNYARYHGKLIGTTEVPNAAFADVWKRLAEHYRDEDAILGFGIMNEPHGTDGLWPAAAQAAVDAIRSVDSKHTVFACGDGWSGAHSWQKTNRNFLLTDPADNLIYEAHQYFDHNHSGTYSRSYDEEGAYPTVGVDRLQPFIQWLEEHNARGFLGEFAVPDNDPRWLVVLDNTLAEMQKHGLGGAYWAAGPWWGDYPLCLEPRNGNDRPQMAVIEQYLKPQSPRKEKPWLQAAKAAEAAAQKARDDDARLGKRVHDFGTRKEAYHYSNDGSQFASDAVEDNGRQARKISFKHVGSPAWVGLGLYFGALDCQSHESFLLDVRVEQPCQLEIKVYDMTGKRYVASFDVETKWQLLSIPFAELKSDNMSFTAQKPIEKIEFQPSRAPAGNHLYLGAFRLNLKPK